MSTRHSMKKRITYLDLIKLIALTFVCFSHVYQRVVPDAINNRLFEFFYSLHMGLFMFVGGFLIKKTSSFKEQGKYILKLMLGYLFPAILFTFITVLIVPNYANHDILYWFKEFVLRTDTFYWYFISAFIINISISSSYTLSTKIAKNKVLNISLMIVLNILCLSVLIVLYKYIGRDFLALDLTIFYYFIAAIGFITFFIHGYIETTQKNNIIKIITMSIAITGYIIGFILLDNWVKMSNFLIDDYHFIWYLFTSISGVIAIYTITIYLVKLRMFDILSKYGKYSKEFYLIHVLFLRIVTPYVNKIATINHYSIIFIITYSLIILISSLAFSILLSKNKYISLMLFGNITAQAQKGE